MIDMCKTRKLVDTVVFVSLIITTVALIVPLFVDDGEIKQTYGDIFVLATHAFAVPAFLILFGCLGDKWYTRKYQGWWYIVVLLYSFVVSICYHVAKITEDDNAVVAFWDDCDVSAQNLLLTNTVILLIYDTGETPWVYWYPLSVILAIFMGFFGNASLVLSVKVFEVIAGLIFIVLGVYVLATHSEKEGPCCTLNPKFRNKSLLVIALVFAVVGLSTFIAASMVQRSDYALVHSIWHIYAYSLLYFILRAITKHEKEQAVVPNKNEEISPFLGDDPFLDVDVSELDQEHLLKL